ncbi:DUF4153 domain-containing protein [Phenylobacterium montanum]|uniref:DUF4173 domain-containing protein n=1 Tax=Phenylobacterium montanum TaxID=2823693 RepID=A0A975FY32_9CAUL|nr:DUF4173 domain-containing protein [Caulobacter sp. S6]QUD87415.1 DUF4173 domain-containing protein [Caulobacter sp. S6]
MGRSDARAPRLWAKAAWAAGLTLAADQLFYGHPGGSVAAGFTLALAVALLSTHPEIGRDRRAKAAFVVAILAALSLADRPTFVAEAFLAAGLSVAVLAGRSAPEAGLGRWAARMAFQGVAALAGPALDLAGLRRILRKRPLLRPPLLPILALPVTGAAVFLTLFAVANPVIGQVLTEIAPPEPDIWRIGYALMVLTGVWALLRPRLLPPAKGVRTAPIRPSAGVAPASIALSLGLFNALFAIENGLDIAFLWSGAPLPHGVTLAGYAHRGAYTLIATALLAGLFVLVFLRPGSDSSRRPWIRRLVVLWVAQNLVLVASSALRTADYIETYSLTRLRIAALVWMVLVALGLVLICWRLLRTKSAGWLIGVNATAAALALAGCAAVDLGAVAASWNVTHAREFGGTGAALDVCYLAQLGDSALVPLSALAASRLPPDLQGRVATVRANILDDLAARQGEWRSWTWRGQVRLDRALALAPASHPPIKACDS